LLVLLELTAAHLGWTFSLSYAVVEALVLWALGVSMMVMAGLLWLPRVALTVIVFVTIAGHNLLDGTRFDIVALHAPGAVDWGDHRVEFVYPIVPWPAVMAAGYLLGPHLAHAKKLGAALILAFLLVRGIDIYGDPHQWRPHLDLLLATTKYPPSLAFLLMTLGPALVALPFLERPSFLVAIGRVPLFFWLLHVPLIHALSKMLPEASGVLAVWLLSALVIAMLYVPCRIFAGLKETRRYAWLAYV
jgi:uncharacterized membrane protein